MTRALHVLARHQLNSSAWDACVAASPQRVVYGYSWYLDAVLPGPNWKWVGVVVEDSDGNYQAVMPIPLRRKRVAGLTYAWVVHQPFFCQFLGIFSREEAIESTPFFQILSERFRYVSRFSTRQFPADLFPSGTFQRQTTHIIDLSVSYEQIAQNYSHDRRLNLRRAHQKSNWSSTTSSDLEPLLTLFRENHADTIEGGVAAWAYDMLRNLLVDLEKRGLSTVRYALLDGRIEAGALFVREGNRIIYLFNAASEVGRRGNARTLLIDQMLREYAGCPLIFDFESPQKPGIRTFYESFGAVEDSFWTIRWNRLTAIENAIRKGINALRSK